jgi:hypothetical protein
MPLNAPAHARPPRLLLALSLCAALLGTACSSGDECDKCSSDDDCKSGLVCSTFNDGSRRCASGIGATNCRTR